MLNPCAPAKPSKPFYVGPGRELHPHDISRLEATGDWVAQEKVDGSWCCLRVVRGQVIDARSRSGKQLEVDYLDGVMPRITATLIGELLPRERRVVVFDVVDDEYEMMAGRRAKLERMGFTHPRALLVRQWASSFAQAFNEIVEAGGEGMVLKRLDGVLGARTRAGKLSDWVKVKPVVSVEYVCMSSSELKDGRTQVELGLIKAGRLQRVLVAPCAKACGRPLPGTVVEVQGSEVDGIGRVRNAVAMRQRDDKEPADCTVSAALCSRATIPEDEPEQAPAKPQKPTKARRGTGGRKGRHFIMRVTEEERASWDAAAQAAGLTTSEWARQLLDYYAQR